MKLAQIQMHVTADKAANLRHAEDLLRSVRGADMAILPEMFCCPYDNACFRAYGEPEGGPAYQMLSRAAAAQRRVDGDLRLVRIHAVEIQLHHAAHHIEHLRTFVAFMIPQRR